MLKCVNTLKIDQDIGCGYEEHGRRVDPDKIALYGEALPPVAGLLEDVVLGQDHHPCQDHQEGEQDPSHWSPQVGQG